MIAPSVRNLPAISRDHFERTTAGHGRVWWAVSAVVFGAVLLLTYFPATGDAPRVRWWAVLLLLLGAALVALLAYMNRRAQVATVFTGPRTRPAAVQLTPAGHSPPEPLAGSLDAHAPPSSAPDAHRRRMAYARNACPLISGREITGHP